MSKEYQLRVIQKTLIELGYADVSNVLAQRVLEDSVVLQKEHEINLQTLVSSGDYSTILSILAGGPEKSPSGLYDMISRCSEEERNTLRYLVLRFSFIEQILHISLGLAPQGAIDEAFSLLKHEMSDLVGSFNQNKLPESLRGLSKESEYSLLLPLVLDAPSRDMVKQRIFNPLILMGHPKAFDASTASRTLREACLHALLAYIQEIAPEAKSLSLQMRIPDNYLHDLITEACFREASKSVYYLPPRRGPFSSDAFIDQRYTLPEPSREDLPIHLRHTLNNHTDEVWFTRFSPSGNFLATGSLDGTCLIYDVTDDFKLIAELIASPEDETRVFVNTSHKPLMDKKKGIIYFSWDPYERYIVTCCLDTVIRVWNVENLSHSKRVTRSMLNSDNVQLVSCFTLGERLRTWPCEFLTYDKHKPPHFIVGSPDKVLKVFSIDGTEILDFYSDADEWLEILGENPKKPSSQEVDDTASAEESPSENTTGNGASQFNRINDFAITPNGKVLVTANNDKQVFFYKIPDLFDPSATTSRFALLSLNGRITSCNISADGNYMLLSIAPEELQIWDISSLGTYEKPFLKQKFFGQSQSIYIVRSCFGYLATSTMREELVLSGSDDGHVYIWKALNGQLISRVKGHEGLCNSVDWNRMYKLEHGPDYGKYWCSVGDDKLVRIWGPKK